MGRPVWDGFVAVSVSTTDNCEPGVNVLMPGPLVFMQVRAWSAVIIGGSLIDLGISF